MNGLLSGRLTRRAFWAMSVIVMATKVVLMFWVTTNAVVLDAIFFLPWVWMASRRFHDFNASGWWSLLPFGAGFVEGFVKGFVRAAHGAEASASPVSVSHPLSHLDWSGLTQYPLDFAIGFARGAVNGVITQFAASPFSSSIGWIIVLILAFYPGTPGANRFGESPRRSA